MTDAQSILDLWREHFYSLLNGSEEETPGDGELESPIDDDGKVVTLPDYEEVPIAIARSKNYKAAGTDGLPAELFSGEELNRCIHQLLCKIWLDEIMPND